MCASILKLLKGKGGFDLNRKLKPFLPSEELEAMISSVGGADLKHYKTLLSKEKSIQSNLSLPLLEE